eukprot:PhM_4_TR1857/c1_g1_i1/m.61554
MKLFFSIILIKLLLLLHTNVLQGTSLVDHYINQLHGVVQLRAEVHRAVVQALQPRARPREELVDGVDVSTVRIKRAAANEVDAIRVGLAVQKRLCQRTDNVAPNHSAVLRGVLLLLDLVRELVINDKLFPQLIEELIRDVLRLGARHDALEVLATEIEIGLRNNTAFDEILRDVLFCNERHAPLLEVVKDGHLWQTSTAGNHSVVRACGDLPAGTAAVLDIGDPSVDVERHRHGLRLAALGLEAFTDHGNDEVQQHEVRQHHKRPEIDEGNRTVLKLHRLVVKVTNDDTHARGKGRGDVAVVTQTATEQCRPGNRVRHDDEHEQNQNTQNILGTGVERARQDVETVVQLHELEELEERNDTVEGVEVNLELVQVLHPIEVVRVVIFVRERPRLVLGSRQPHPTTDEHNHERAQVYKLKERPQREDERQPLATVAPLTHKLDPVVQHEKEEKPFVHQTTRVGREHKEVTETGICEPAPGLRDLSKDLICGEVVQSRVVGVELNDHKAHRLVIDKATKTELARPLDSLVVRRREGQVTGETTARVTSNLTSDGSEGLAVALVVKRNVVVTIRGCVFVGAREGAVAVARDQCRVRGVEVGVDIT